MNLEHFCTNCTEPFLLQGLLCPVEGMSMFSFMKKKPRGDLKEVYLGRVAGNAKITDPNCSWLVSEILTRVTIKLTVL